jgi:hypothetical protein
MSGARGTLNTLLQVEGRERAGIVRGTVQGTADVEIRDLAAQIAELVPGIGPSGALELLARIGWAAVLQEEVNGASKK